MAEATYNVVQKLYNCQDCDEFVIEEDYAEHVRRCDGKERPWLMSEAQLQTLVRQREARDPYWEDRFKDMMEAFKSMMHTWKASKRTGGLRMPFEMMCAVSGHIDPVLDTYGDHIRPREYIHSTNMNMYSIRVNLPVWLKEDEAMALCWEQIYGQWPTRETPR